MKYIAAILLLMASCSPDKGYDLLKEIDPDKPLPRPVLEFPDSLAVKHPAEQKELIN